MIPLDVGSEYVAGHSEAAVGASSDTHIVKKSDNKLDSINNAVFANCLVKSEILTTIMQMPITTQNHDIVRICLKILVQMMNCMAKELYIIEEN